MKRIFTITLLAIFMLVQVHAQDSIPEINKKIVEYIHSVIGKKVDRGECWDIAYQALTRNNCDWDGQFKYGKLLDPKKDSIYPGDIIQFKNVMVEYKSADGRQTSRENMGQHTAIVYKINTQGDFILAHQNTSFSGRKVGTSAFVLKNIKKGKIFIYRPVAKN